MFSDSLFPRGRGSETSSPVGGDFVGIRSDDLDSGRVSLGYQCPRCSSVFPAECDPEDSCPCGSSDLTLVLIETDTLTPEQLDLIKHGRIVLVILLLSGLAWWATSEQGFAALFWLAATAEWLLYSSFVGQRLTIRGILFGALVSYITGFLVGLGLFALCVRAAMVSIGIL